VAVDSGNARRRSFTIGELRLVVLETTPQEGVVQITPPTIVEIKEGNVIAPGYSWMIDRIREAIRNVHDALQEFLKEYSRSSFESFLSNIGNKSKNQDPLLDAPHKTGIYFIFLREEMDFLSGKPFYIGYAKNFNERMHDLFPDENGKYQHGLSVRMLVDVLKRSTSPPGGWQPVFDSCDDYTTFLKNNCDFWFSTTGEANDQQALATASMLKKMLDLLLEPCMVWNRTTATVCEHRMQDFRERTRAAFYTTP